MKQTTSDSVFTCKIFDEDGSFIGQYGMLQRRQHDQLLQQQMKEQELGIKQPRGIYVLEIVLKGRTKVLTSYCSEYFIFLTVVWRCYCLVSENLICIFLNKLT